MTAGPGRSASRSPTPPVGETITFSSKLRGHTITLTSGELDITQDLTIDGPGAGQLAVSGDDSSEVFNIGSGATVTISGLTITDGNASDGGGIANAGTLTLEDSARDRQPGDRRRLARVAGSTTPGTMTIARQHRVRQPGDLTSGGGIYNCGHPDARPHRRDEQRGECHVRRRGRRRRHRERRLLARSRSPTARSPTT